jgi:putative two-component system response regulator
VWDAITNDRVYREAMPYGEAIEVIKEGIGTHFDPEIAHHFLEMIEDGHQELADADTGVEDGVGTDVAVG